MSEGRKEGRVGQADRKRGGMVLVSFSFQQRASSCICIGP